MSGKKGSDIYSKEVLSTDTKPVNGFAGELIIETDTGAVYEWSGSNGAWFLRTAPFGSNTISIDPGSAADALQNAYDLLLAKDQVEIIGSTAGVAVGGSVLSGTVAVNQDDLHITGTSTDFLAVSGEGVVYPLYISFGAGTVLNDRKWYQIKETTTSSKLTLTVPFQEANISGEDYVIASAITRTIYLMPGNHSYDNVTTTANTGFITLTGLPGASLQSLIRHEWVCGKFGLSHIQLPKYTESASLTGYGSTAGTDIVDLYLNHVEYSGGQTIDGILRGGGECYVKDSKFKSTWHTDSFAQLFKGEVYLEDSHFICTFNGSGQETPNYTGGSADNIMSIHRSVRCVYELLANDNGNFFFQFGSPIAGVTAYKEFHNCEFRVSAADNVLTGNMYLIQTTTNNATAVLNLWFKKCIWTISPRLSLGTVTDILATSGTSNIRLEDCDMPDAQAGLLITGYIEYDRPVVVKTTSHTATISDHGKVLKFDSSGGALAPVLPSAAARKGMRVCYKKVDASGLAVTVTRAGGDTIDGATTHALAAQYNYIWLESDGTSNWMEISVG